MMIKQSNMKSDLELSKNVKKNQDLTRTRNQSIEKNYICQRFAARLVILEETLNYIVKKARKMKIRWVS
jgi:hypothetical protein